MPVHVQGCFHLIDFSNSSISQISKFSSVWYTVMIVCDRTSSCFRSHGSCIFYTQRQLCSETGTSFVDLLWVFCLAFAMNLYASVYMGFVVTCWERADLLALVCGV